MASHRNLTFGLHFKSMAKILVTGGAGFIGSHTAVALSEAGYVPVIVDDFSNSTRDIVASIAELCPGPIHLHTGNCCDAQFIRSVFKSHEISGVIHFAAYKAVGESVQKPMAYFENNIGSLTTLLTIMGEYNVSDIVFSSSCTVYGIPDHLPVDETTPVKSANSPYGYTKQVCEHAVQYTANSEQPLRGVLLRYFNPIGAHPSGKIGELPLGVPNNLVPFITQTAAGLRDELKVFGKDYDTPDGTCIRDYIHVMDLARAHVQSLDWLKNQRNGTVKVFNVGTGDGCSVQEVIDTFELVSGLSLPYRYTDRRPGDVPAIFADASLAEKELGWKAEKTMADALRDAWNWEQQLRKK